MSHPVRWKQTLPDNPCSLYGKTKQTEIRLVVRYNCSKFLLHPTLILAFHRFPHHLQQNADDLPWLADMILRLVHRRQGLFQAEEFPEAARCDHTEHGGNGILLFPIETLRGYHLSKALRDPTRHILVFRLCYRDYRSLDCQLQRRQRQQVVTDAL